MDFLSQIPEPRINYLDPRLSTYNLQATNRSEPVNSQPKIDQERDRQLIDSWLMSKGKFIVPSQPRVRNDFTLSFAKQSLGECLKIVEEMSACQLELDSKIETMSSNEWKQKSLDLATLKEKFDKLMVLFEDNVNLNSLKWQIKQRKRKRTNQKRRKRLHEQNRKTQKDEILKKHKEIDRCLELARDEVEKAKMEEKIKINADCVLYEVTKKKSEARKHLSLIFALVKLRTVRDSMATQRGEKVSLEDRQAFGSVTEKLIRMWENSFQGYLKEEQCLRVMLEDTVVKDHQAARVLRKQAVDEEWERVCFGPRGANLQRNPIYWALTSAERDMEAFIAIRKSWDTFLKANGTGIPVGWVMPPDAPSAGWERYLNLNGA